jgi:hypothetical protein
MRNLTSWILVAAIASIAAAAIASSFLGGDEAAAPGPSPTTETVPQDGQQSEASRGEERELTADERAGIARVLSDVGAYGVLYVSDEDCRVRGYQLPSLETVAGISGRACRFPVLSRTATPLRPALPSTASCHQEAECAPAWKPNGTLTFVRDGEVLRLEALCGNGDPSCERVALSRADLRRALAGFSLPRIREIAWLSNTRVLAVVGIGRGGAERDLVALFEGKRLAARSALRQPGLSLLRVSPSRALVAIRAPSFGRMWLLRPQGRSLNVKPFPPWSPPAPTDIHAIAWSPDERFTAVASRRAVYVFHTGASARGYIGLPLAAADIAWR